MSPEAAPVLESALEALRDADPFDAETIEGALRGVVERTGAKPKQVFQPLRVAITGGTVSPGIFESLAVLGRERSLERIQAAITRLG
jgi:glutamyl-tRNA synthetase